MYTHRPDRGRSDSTKEIGQDPAPQRFISNCEDKYRLLFESAHDAILILQDGRFVDCNAKTLEMVGCSREDIIGQPPARFFPPSQPGGGNSDKVASEKISLALQGKPQRFEWLHTRLDGTIFETEVSLNRVDIADKICLLAIVRDVSRRKSAQREQALHLKFLESILENIPDVVFVKDADTLNFLKLNKAGERLLGFFESEVIGKTMGELFPEEKTDFYTSKDLEAISAKALAEVSEERIKIGDRDARIFLTKRIPILDETGKPKHLLCILEDVTEFKKLQSRLTQAQKMEAIGNISGGIAHDFNNILQPILGYCEILKDNLTTDNPLKKHVGGIHSSALRAKDLVNQILTIARRTEHKMVPVRFPMILKEATKLCRAVIPSNIEIRHDIQKVSAPVLANPTQLHQIAMNLITNAHHAVEKTGGAISVRLSEAKLGEKDLVGTTLQPGRYAVLSISDTGRGIEPAIMDRIFDPYFTTKEEGKGTGLGLSVVYGIVREHRGDIKVASQLGKGATFTVYLPLVEPPTEKGVAPQQEEKTRPGTEGILVVDDEETIITLLRSLLEQLGYQVTTRLSSIDALEAFKANPDAYDLVITDMAMPNMTGDELAINLIAIKPDIPIIICTGFSDKISMDKSKALGIKEFLMKPVSASELSRIVRKVLD